MSLLGTVLLIFTGSLVQMYRSTGKSEALSGAQAQLHVAFQRLDREVRYASAIAEPSAAATSLGNWYVEFLTTNTVPAVCTELRLGTRLQQRSWTSGQLPAQSWTTLASGVAAVGRPFDLTADQTGTGYQRLAVRISASAGGARDAADRAMSVTFTGLNTSVDSPVPTSCSQYRPAS
jgi:hypothetical protein